MLRAVNLYNFSWADIRLLFFVLHGTIYTVSVLKILGKYSRFLTTIKLCLCAVNFMFNKSLCIQIIYYFFLMLINYRVEGITKECPGWKPTGQGWLKEETDLWFKLICSKNTWNNYSVYKITITGTESKLNNMLFFHGYYAPYIY